MRTLRNLALIAGMVMTGSSSVADARPPQWDKTVDSNRRFKVLRGFDGEAALDRETGLVWTRIATDRLARRWDEAFLTCVNLEVGGRRGFRLPTIYELQSLTEDGELPPSAPFNFDADEMWSTTASPSSNAVLLAGGSPWTVTSDSRVEAHAFVCVRAGSGPAVIP